MFDPKEDILEFELTSHGKKLLADGKFKPEYYSFSDDDVIYDLQYAGISENLSNFEERLLNKTPYRKIQTSYVGVKDRKGTELQEQFDRDYQQTLSLGTSQPGNRYAPAWNVSLYSGEITGTYTEITGTANVKIPQLVLAPQDYQISVINNLPESVYNQVQLEGIEPGVVGNYQRFEDGTFIEVVPQDIFIELSEINSIMKDDNFYMEVYVYEGSGSSEELKQLFFSQTTKPRTDIYEEDDFFDYTNFELLEDSVEKYFNIEVDNEIPNHIICKYVPQDRRQGVYGNFLDCEDDRRFVLNIDEGPEDDEC